MRGRVPLLILVPGVKDDVTTSDPAGQIDLPPTALHLLGIADTSTRFLGRNLFRMDPDPIVYLRSGNFLSRSQIFVTRDGGFAPEDGASLDDHTVFDPVLCKEHFDEIQLRIAISDRIHSADQIPQMMKTPPAQ